MKRRDLFRQSFNADDNWNGMGTPDRTWRNNDTDGQVFYGYDDGEGNTEYYTSDGALDCVLPTPSDDEQIMNDEGW